MKDSSTSTVSVSTTMPPLINHETAILITQPKYVCEICNKGFKSGYNLKRHQKDYHGENSEVCLHLRSEEYRFDYKHYVRWSRWLVCWLLTKCGFDLGRAYVTQLTINSVCTAFTVRILIFHRLSEPKLRTSALFARNHSSGEQTSKSSSSSSSSLSSTTTASISSYHYHYHILIISSSIHHLFLVFNHT